MRTLIPLLAALALGCNSGKGDVDGDGSGTTDGTGGTGSGGNGLSGENPVVENGIIYCQAGSESSGNVFFVELEVDDPQGKYTIEEDAGYFVAYDLSGNEMFRDEFIACQSDGECSHSFNEINVAPVTCATHEDYQFFAAVQDYDGNYSEETEVIWQD